MKNGVNIKFIAIVSVKLGFLSCKGVHGGQIQPVTTRLRVNIRECGYHIELYNTSNLFLI